MLVALLIVVVFFQITTDGVMLKSLNVTNVFLQNGYILVMALGMLLIIVIGHIDLSVGSVAGFLGAIVAVLLVGVEVPVLGEVQLDPILAVAVTLIAGGLIGVFQGAWIAYLRVPSFIVTLAGMLLFRGATLFMLGGQPVGPFPESFRAISSGFIPELIRKVADPFGTGTPPIAIGPLVLPVRWRTAQPDHAAARRDPQRVRGLPRLALPPGTGEVRLRRPVHGPVLAAQRP